MIQVKVNKELMTVTFIGDDEVRQELKEAEDYCRREDIFRDNLPSDWLFVCSEDVSALTSSPTIVYDPGYDDEGKLEDCELICWYPNYAVEDFTTLLIERGSVTFDLAPET